MNLSSIRDICHQFVLAMLFTVFLKAPWLYSMRMHRYDEMTPQATPPQCWHMHIAATDMMELQRWMVTFSLRSNLNTTRLLKQV